MGKSLELYNMDNGEAMELLAQEECSSYEEKVMEGIRYVVYTFPDKSILTVGDNGYVGSEE